MTRASAAEWFSILRTVAPEKTRRTGNYQLEDFPGVVISPAPLFY
ncbi:MAG: hypothetical protein WB562_12590 [Candidatus Sulfotelmatobacter sp.]